MSDGKSLAFRLPTNVPVAIIAPGGQNVGTASLVVVPVVYTTCVVDPYNNTVSGGGERSSAVCCGMFGMHRVRSGRFEPPLQPAREWLR